jgi:DNA-binding Lrp family transcriptional regulator
MDLSPTDKIILRELQNRKFLNLKSAHENTFLSYRQFLRRIDDLFERKIMKGWSPIIHPFAHKVKKFIWLFLKTNPKDPQDLDYLRSLEGLLSLDGIAGSFSMVALIQFQNEQEYHQSLSNIEKAFQVRDPTKELLRYFPLEIIAFYKYNGVAIKKEFITPSTSEYNMIYSLLRMGYNRKRPPTKEELADDLKISTSSVSKILKSLNQKQILLGHGIILDQKFKPKVKMIVQFKIHPRSLIDIISCLQDDVHVNLIAKTQSEYSLLSTVFFHSIQNFNVWLKEMYINEDILDTITTVVLDDEFKNNRSGLFFPVL